MNKSIPLKAAILSIFFLIMGPSLLIPAIQSLSAAFPEVPYSTILLLQTLPCLLLIPIAIIAGALAGSKVKYRTLNIIGIVLFIIGGVIPFFLNDFTSILLARALYGIAIGIISPMGNALVLKLFAGQERVNLLGTGNVMMMIGGIVMQLLGGILCAISWRYTFLVHLIAIIPLLLVVLYLPEPEKNVQHLKEKVKIPFSVYGYTLMFGAMVMLNYTMILNVSTIIADRSLGSPASAGIVLSMFTVGGMIAGLIFGKIYKVTARFTIAFGMFIAAAGLGIADFAGSIVILTVGTMITGIGFTTVLPAVTMEIGAIVPPFGIGVASGILTALMNGGMFFSPYFMTLVQKVTHQDNVWFPICVSMSLLVIGGILFILYKLKQKPLLISRK